MVKRPPTLDTDRLQLRPFTLDDAPRVRELAGHRLVAETTLLIPHPYEEGMAEPWIATHLSNFLAGESLTLAITLRSGGEMIGCIGLGVTKAHRRAEMGYWIGVPFWGNGYCTEAARAVIAYGFSDMDLVKITSHHYAGNPASGRVMQKCGMKREGSCEKHVLKDGTFHDTVVYGLVRPD